MACGCGCSTRSTSPTSRWWDLLAGLRTVEDARRLARHFVLTVTDENRRDLWGPAAQDLLAALFLAAASSDHTLHDVAEWLNEPAVPTPSNCSPPSRTPPWPPRCAARICRIADLPDLYPHLGSGGIIPVTILQSYEQGVTV